MPPARARARARGAARGRGRGASRPSTTVLRPARRRAPDRPVGSGTAIGSGASSDSAPPPLLGSTAVALGSTATAGSSGVARRRTGCDGRRPGSSCPVGPAAAPELLSADVVIVTAPAQKAARLLAGAVPGAVEPLQGIPYASMAVVAMAFPAQDVAAGFGAAGAAGHRPAGQGRHRVVGEVAAPGRGTRCWCVRRWAGSATSPELQRRTTTSPLRWSPTSPTCWTCRAREPLETRLVRWGGGLPQYLVGHRRGSCDPGGGREVPGPGDRRRGVPGRRRAGLHPGRPPRRRRAAVSVAQPTAPRGMPERAAVGHGVSNSLPPSARRRPDPSAVAFAAPRLDGRLRRLPQAHAPAKPAEPVPADTSR